jgi:hypothetical protein
METHPPKSEGFAGVDRLLQSIRVRIGCEVIARIGLRRAAWSPAVDKLACAAADLAD